MESKTKFDFKNTSINDLKPAKDLKPVIAKKKENKEIKILRETFTKDKKKNEQGNKTLDINKKSDIASNRYKNNALGSSIKGLKDIKGKNLDKVVIKAKNTNSKGDKFLEELKMRRIMGNK